VRNISYVHGLILLNSFLLTFSMSLIHASWCAIAILAPSTTTNLAPCLTATPPREIYASGGGLLVTPHLFTFSFCLALPHKPKARDTRANIVSRHWRPTMLAVSVGRQCWPVCRGLLFF